MWANVDDIGEIPTTGMSQDGRKTRSSSMANSEKSNDQGAAMITSDSRVQSSENTGTTDTGFEGSVTNSDPIQVQLAKIASGQTAILTKIRENHEDLKGMIVREVTKVREDVFLELAQVTRRLEAIESKPDFVLPREPFCPDNTVVIANLTAVGTNENEVLLMEKINHLLTVGLGLPGIEPVAVTRKASRGRGPGLVQLELNDIEDKKTVLKAKTNLKNCPEYNNIYVRSAEGHTDRLMRLNFTTLLDHLNITREFRFTGSGRLVPRDNSHRSRTNDPDATEQSSATSDRR